jgi:two-component system sensor histidine kinase ChvG
MVSALYDRIDANEQFAADVSHEIKNPLASLRSAVGTMRVARKRDEQRNRCWR